MLEWGFQHNEGQQRNLWWPVNEINSKKIDKSCKKYSLVLFRSSLIGGFYCHAIKILNYYNRSIHKTKGVTNTEDDYLQKFPQEYTTNKSVSSFSIA